MKYQKLATVVSNEEMCSQHYRLVLEAPEIAAEFKAGQFVQIRVPESEDLILRRPFSIARADKKNITVYYKTVGEGTRRMTLLKSGEKADIIGPLGNSFNTDILCDNIILVGGGIGIAPMIALADEFKNKEFALFMGVKSKDAYAYAQALKDFKQQQFIATEDGSLGEKGFVTAALFDFWKKNNLKDKKSAVYACGPRCLLKIINDFLKEEGPEADFYVAFEEKMACGVGACRGCVVPTQDGYRSVCKDAPIFDGRRILWDELDNAV